MHAAPKSDAAVGEHPFKLIGHVFGVGVVGRDAGADEAERSGELVLEGRRGWGVERERA
jgi:hypothetical protein